MASVVSEDKNVYLTVLSARESQLKQWNVMMNPFDD